MEYIEEIKELDGSTRMDGFKVITSEQEIILGIQNVTSCCETWGYFWCNDDVKEFIGAQVVGVTLTNEALITEKVPNIYEGGVMFVNIETDRGILQFVCYNKHNGYYGHKATVMCNQLTHREML